MNKNTSVKTVRLVQQIGADIDWNTKANKRLVQAILALKTEDEARRFLRDLLTPAEIKEFANRLEAASLLSKDVQYNAISESTGLSSATIARIKKWLEGSLGGYRLILSRLNIPSKTLRTIQHRNSFKVRKGLFLST